ncbi:hypothetical protein COLO4_00189 [Corchorus olitorius]|uniref:Uncharacterized protein n=1 Tax=Corchorus olitorius TaxID=93759 RepID=A0A1R3L4G2_9ROSI|nr:hypothetical protein COLO4_00189 [Corchorus olitorius]
MVCVWKKNPIRPQFVKADGVIGLSFLFKPCGFSPKA